MSAEKRHGRDPQGAGDELLSVDPLYGHQTPNKGRTPHTTQTGTQRSREGKKQDLRDKCVRKQGWDLCMHVDLEKEMECAERQSRQTHKGGRLPRRFSICFLWRLETRKGKRDASHFHCCSFSFYVVFSLRSPPLPRFPLKYGQLPTRPLALLH